MNQCTENDRVHKGQLLVEMGKRKLEGMLGKIVTPEALLGTLLLSPYLGIPFAQWAAPPFRPHDLDPLRTWLCPWYFLSEIQWLFLSSFLPRLQTLGRV